MDKVTADTDAERKILEEAAESIRDSLEPYLEPLLFTEDSFPEHPITCCPRCGGNHGYVPILPLERVADEWSHYALCPTNGQPIMIATSEGDYVLLEDALKAAHDAIYSGDGSDMKASLLTLMIALRPAWFDEHREPVNIEEQT